MTTIASTPWRVSEGTIDYGSFRVMANGGRLVAVVWSGASAKTMVTDMVAMAEANARLIAAAADLRDALKEARNRLQQFDLSELDRLVAVCDAALAKAEGQGA